MIITIGGSPGAGTTAVSRLLAEKLGYKLVTIGELHKKIAGEKGFSTQKFHESWEQDVKDWDAFSDFHKKLDAEQKRIAKEDGDIVFNSKLGAFQIPEADLKVFLRASLETRAQRFAQREGVSQEEALKSIQSRETLERSEWKKLYGFDYIADYDVYDLIINTDNLGIEQIVEIIQKMTELKG